MVSRALHDVAGAEPGRAALDEVGASLKKIGVGAADVESILGMMPKSAARGGFGGRLHGMAGDAAARLAADSRIARRFPGSERIVEGANYGVRSPRERGPTLSREQTERLHRRYPGLSNVTVGA